MLNHVVFLQVKVCECVRKKIDCRKTGMFLFRTRSWTQKTRILYVAEPGKKQEQAEKIDALFYLRLGALSGSLFDLECTLDVEENSLSERERERR